MSTAVLEKNQNNLGKSTVTINYYDGTSKEMPVVDKEVPYPDGKLIVSRTDKTGIITHCNQSFVDMSGYSEEELIGVQHSILRHPDMPAAAFKDLWDTLERGEKWHGYVKNLRKDGTYYWVYATAIPNIRNGETVGYTSVRRKPSRTQVNACIELYAKNVNGGTIMSTVMSVSPDFSPDHIAGWYIFNTYLQRQLELPIHLELYNNFDAQRNAIANDEIDLIFANPYDASMLVRDKGFTAIAAPENSADEAIIATRADSDIKQVEDLQAGTHIAHTDDPDVNMMGMIMLEPADLNKDNTTSTTVDSYPLVAKQLLQGNADVGFFLDESFDNLSGLIKDQMRLLIRSQIFVIRHVLLAGPKLAEKHQVLRDTLQNMQNDEKGPGVLKALGFTNWEIQEHEDTEFMIDLMETLVD